MRALVAKGLTATGALWPAIRVAYDWAHRAARLLGNEDGAPGARVRRRMDALLAEMRAGQATLGTLQPAVAHFLKVSASYWPGLFHCYDVAGLPRTNNDQEQYFGSARYHQRRASGRVHASAATVVRGSVRVLAATAARLHVFGEYELRHPIWSGGGLSAGPSNCAGRRDDSRDASARTRRPTWPRWRASSSRVCRPRKNGAATA